MAAIPFLFLTITSYSYVGLPPGKSGQASALINVARNLGGSIGVSMAQTLLARREQFHQSRLGESLSPTSLAYRQTLEQATAYFQQHGASAADASRQAIAFDRPDADEPGRLPFLHRRVRRVIAVCAASRPAGVSAAARRLTISAAESLTRPTDRARPRATGFELRRRAA